MARTDMGFADNALPGELKPGPEDYFELGIAFATGDEVEADLIAAHKWFNLAALAGNREAADHRHDLADEMTDAEIAAAQRAAREWLTRH